MNMNNNINEANCSFQVSKLLKEWGFNVHCILCYLSTGVYTLDIDSSVSEEDRIYCPTHALAIEWLRVNFGIDISVQPRRKSDFKKIYIYSLHEHGGDSKISMGYETPQEATEAALVHVLNNLEEILEDGIINKI